MKKGGETPGKTDTPMEQRMVKYQTHVQDIGNSGWVYDGELAGSVGKSKRMEAISILLPSLLNVNVNYSAHIQDIGWQKEKKNGQLAGTEGQSKRLEAIKIRLSGKEADQYDIYYQVHAQDYGWLAGQKMEKPPERKVCPSDWKQFAL